MLQVSLVPPRLSRLCDDPSGRDSVTPLQLTASFAVTDTDEAATRVSPSAGEEETSAGARALPPPPPVPPVPPVPPPSPPPPPPPPPPIGVWLAAAAVKGATW